MPLPQRQREWRGVSCATQARAFEVRTRRIRSNRQQLRILCAPVCVTRTAVSVPGDLAASRPDRWGHKPRGRGRHDNHKDHRDIDSRTGTSDHVGARRRHRPQGAEEGREPPPPPCDLAFGGGIQSDYNFRGISQTDRGPGVFAYVEPRCKIHPNVELYAGIWGWSTKLPTRRPANSTSTAASARPSVRSRSISASCTTGIRARRSCSSPIRSDHGQSDELRLRPVHGARHRHVGDLRQGHLDGDRLARDRRLRLLHAELARLRREGAPTPAAT